jgi:hypothetical protein
MVRSLFLAAFAFFSFTVCAADKYALVSTQVENASLWSRQSFKDSYEVAPRVQASADVCFGAILNESLSRDFALWDSEGRACNSFRKVPMEDVVVLYRGKVLSSSGKIIGAGGGVANYSFELRDEDGKLRGKLEQIYLHGNNTFRLAEWK